MTVIWEPVLRPGVVIDELVDKMGLRGTQTSNLKLDVVVPDSARVGEPGRALRLAFATLVCRGGCWSLRNRSVSRSPPIARRPGARSERRASGQPIIENQSHSAFGSADMAVEISAARMMLYGGCQGLRRGP